MLPESFLNELKYRCDVEQIIGSYVQLRRRGRNLTGLCPFHSEKTPSFTVYPENQSFYCFGCGAGGDIVTFIRRIENLDYMEAIRFLAERVGMQVPENEMDDGAHRLKMRILEINRESARYFHKALMSEAGREARAYLIGRGLGKPIIVRFGIGYAPPGWQNLTDHLSRLGYTSDEMVAAGVANRGKKGGCYDVFRNRVMFPIIDLRGGVIAFGGRRLSEADNPKYVNTGDNPVYKKGRNLYALNFAKNSKRQELLLAEGYMDVVAIHQGGFDNAIAGLGTALTSDQARLISSYTQTVVLCYDSDEAGQKATQKAVRLLDEVGVRTRILSITGAKDPDEFIKKFGAERFQLLIEGSSSAAEFEITKLRRRYDLDTAEGRVGFLQGFVRLMANTPSPIEREVYISKICRELQIDKQAVSVQLDAALKKKRFADQKREDRELSTFAAQSPSAKTDFEKQKYPREALAEEGLIAYLYRSPDKAEWLASQVDPGQMVSPVDRDIYTVLLQRIREGHDPDMMDLGARLEEDRVRKLSEILSRQSGVAVSDAAAADYIRVIAAVGRTKTKEEVGRLEGEELKRYIASLGAGKK